MVRHVTHDPYVDADGGTDDVYLLSGGGWWLLASSDYFAKQGSKVMIDHSHYAHGGQAQLQSHGLVLLLI